MKPILIDKETAELILGGFAATDKYCDSVGGCLSKELRIRGNNLILQIVATFPEIDHDGAIKEGIEAYAKRLQS